MRRAFIMVKRHVEARHDAFCAGFRAAGFKVIETEPRGGVSPGDVLATWNRKGPGERAADAFEAAGGTVLVAENGYVGTDANGHQYLALARHAHNGRGHWNSGGPERWDRLGIDLKPWRADGRHVLVCPNRHFGMRGFIMPTGWEQEIARQIGRHTGRPVKIRPHPGHWKRLAVHPDVTLREDLRDAWAVVVWASSSGVKALIEGIPVIRCAPWWIAAGAAGNDIAQIANPPMPDRRPVFERLAWAQWTVAEIADGTAFRHLLAEQCAEAA